MPALTLHQISQIASNPTFQKRLYAALFSKALYWSRTTNDPLLNKVAGVKYKMWAERILSNTFNRTLETMALIFLTDYRAEENPILEEIGGVLQPSDQVLLSTSTNGKFYTDAFIKDWAGVTDSDEVTDYQLNTTDKT